MKRLKVVNGLNNQLSFRPNSAAQEHGLRKSLSMPRKQPQPGRLKMWQIEASVNDPVERAMLTNTIANDPLVYRRFPSVELAHAALDDFCERKSLATALFNVQDVAS